jgi:hypothetical protein
LKIFSKKLTFYVITITRASSCKLIDMQQFTNSLQRNKPYTIQFTSNFKRANRKMLQPIGFLLVVLCSNFFDATAKNIENSTNYTLLTDPNTSISIKDSLLKGRIVDTNNIPIAYASVVIKANGSGVATDENGDFSIPLTAVKQTKFGLTISCLGYETQEFETTKQQLRENKLTIVLKQSTSTLAEVVVIAYPGRIITCTWGCFLGGTRCNHQNNKAIDSVQKNMASVTKSNINIYPNPAKAGTVISVELKQKGDYILQLVNNSGSIIASKNYNIVSKTILPFHVGTNVLAGVYYVRIINTSSNNITTKKIVIL